MYFPGGPADIATTEGTLFGESFYFPYSGPVVTTSITWKYLLSTHINPGTNPLLRKP